MFRHFRSSPHPPEQAGDGDASGTLDSPVIDPHASARAWSIVEHGLDAVLVVDVLGELRWANPAALALFGAEPPAIGSRIIERLDADDVPGALALLASAAGNPLARPTGEWTLHAAQGPDRVVEVQARSFTDDPTVGGVLLHLHDVTARVAEHRRRAYETLHDPLTRLANRTLLLDRVSHALTIAHRRSAPLTLLLIDIDGFRGINDIFGRTAGDAVLGTIATRLNIALRSSDTAARVGADEFAVLLEQMSDESDFVQISERLLASIAQPMVVNGRQLTVSVTVGIANATPDEDGESLMRNAEVALSLAKRRGRGACEIFEPRMHAAMIERLELEAELRRAVDARELTLRFQPIVILHNRRIAGVEAFLHWQHPERGVIPPAKFIPIAEETGLIVSLGRWAMAEACKQGMAWQRELEQERPLTVTWNVTAAQLLHPGFASDVSEALRVSGLEAHRLVLELTDEVVTRHASQLVSRLHALKAIGVRIAIDDFGTRHSSLRHLPGIPIDILKIDRSFVARVTEYGGESTLAQVIVALGKSLQLRTVADGVDAESQLNQLLAWRCEFGQGSLFADAVDAAGVSALLRRESSGRP